VLTVRWLIAGALGIGFMAAAVPARAKFNRLYEHNHCGVKPRVCSISIRANGEP